MCGGKFNSEYLYINVKTMSEDIRKMIDKVKNFKQFVNENKTLDKWYLVKKNDEFFAEKLTKLKYHNKPQKVLFRDYNNKVMSLGKDEVWASEWIQSKNEIDFGF